MSEQDTAATPSPEDRAASLHAVARALRDTLIWGRCAASPRRIS